jgi:hypothetical protein
VSPSTKKTPPGADSLPSSAQARELGLQQVRRPLEQIAGQQDDVRALGHQAIDRPVLVRGDVVGLDVGEHTDPQGQRGPARRRQRDVRGLEPQIEGTDQAGVDPDRRRRRGRDGHAHRRQPPLCPAGPAPAIEEVPGEQNQRRQHQQIQVREVNEPENRDADRPQQGKLERPRHAGGQQREGKPRHQPPPPRT